MRTITEGQQGFVARLASERNAADFDPILVARLDEARIGSLPMREVDALLASIKSVPRKPLAEAEKAKPGYFVTDAGDVVVVVSNKAKTGTYAKMLKFSIGEAGRKTARWEYAPGVGRTLAGIAPLTVAEAARLGHHHGFCVICAKALTDPASVERGIGPVCQRKLG